MKASPDTDRSSNGGPSRKLPSIILSLVLLAAVGALLAHYLRRPHQAEPVEAAQSDTAPETTASPKSTEIQPERTVPAPVTLIPTAPVAPPVAPPAQPEPSAFSRQLVANLVQLNLTNGPMTAEKLAAWQQALQQLTNAGPAAIPAIREFLQTKVDANFDGIGGSAVAGQASLRLSMLDALTKIGGAEALGLAGDTLRSSLDPREIATLARSLDQQAPGEYRDAALQAARNALAEASAGRLPNVDVGALFSVLQQYGGAGALADFENLTGRWTYYSTIALAGLPDGAGVPALVQLAQDTPGSSRATRSAALQMLAELAPDSADARAALLEQAKAGQLPSVTWIKISALLGGEQMQIGETDPLNPDLKKSGYHLTSGNQNFYTTSILNSLSADQINQRVQLIDQLLAANPNGTGTAPLQQARAALQTRLQSPAAPAP